MNVTMSSAGGIAGTVTDAATSAGIASTCVNAYAGASLTPSGTTGITASDGSYTISGLLPGNYTVSADPTCGGATTSTYAYQTHVNSVTVTSGATGSANFALVSSAGAAPPPTTVSGVTFGTPTTAVSAAGSPTSVVQSELGSSAGVNVPADALPPGTSVSVYPVLNPAAAAQALSGTATTAYVASFGVSWLTTSLTSPPATSPITMTISDPSIAVGDVVYLLTPSGPQAVGTATSTGTITFTFTQDPIFDLSAPAAYPQVSQSINFGALRNEPPGSAPPSVSATATSNLAVSFSSSTPSICTLSGSVVTLVAIGVCSVTASQTGNTYWLAAPDVTESFYVTPLGKAVAWQYGWDGFSGPMNFSESTLIWSLSGSTLHVSAAIFGAIPNTQYTIGLELFYAVARQCRSGFGQFGLGACLEVTRQGVTTWEDDTNRASGIGTIFTNGSGIGTLSLSITGVATGVYDLGFYAQDGSINFQAPGPFGTGIPLTVGSVATDAYRYNAAGGSPTPASGSGLNGTTITLGAAPTRAGYTFAGWSDGTSTATAGTSYLLSSNGAPIIFTAQWTQIVSTSTWLTFHTPEHFGDESLVSFRVKVTSRGGTPVGSVKILAGSRVLCTVLLSRTGVGTCVMARTELTPGRHLIVAEFAPTRLDFSGSRSRAQALVILRAIQLRRGIHRLKSNLRSL